MQGEQYLGGCHGNYRFRNEVATVVANYFWWKSYQSVWKVLWYWK